jgi:hypothetical protein
MAKHTLQQTQQDLLGQYFTKNVDIVLQSYEHLVKNKIVIDPFVGAGHLLEWAVKHGAISTLGYDIEPVNQWCNQKMDTLMNPVDCTNMIVVTNPPYLSKNRNKSGDRRPYDKYDQNDFYKCYLASLNESNVEEALIIIPTNFLCESSDKARKALFANYYIVSGTHFDSPVFEGVKISTCIIHVKKGKKSQQSFPFKNYDTQKVFNVVLKAKYKYIFGENFFKHIKGNEYKIIKTDKGMDAPNTNIIISLLDKGKYGLGLTYNHSEPIYSNPKSITTYQLTIPNVNLTIDQQQTIVREFNIIMSRFRIQYNNMFLGYFIEGEQKILSRKYAHALVSRLIDLVTQE